ncbi:hypothetical protein DRO66_06380 [Candidatus Bathyarchaeota archaeon]|nr:MAG: hypothetical protein DRO66_06380 [Candidatus Bathyarchaeota archaeon]
MVIVIKDIPTLIEYAETLTGFESSPPSIDEVVPFGHMNLFIKQGVISIPLASLLNVANVVPVVKADPGALDSVIKYYRASTIYGAASQSKTSVSVDVNGFYQEFLKYISKALSSDRALNMFWRGCLKEQTSSATLSISPSGGNYLIRINPSFVVQSTLQGVRQYRERYLSTDFSDVSELVLSLLTFGIRHEIAHALMDHFRKDPDIDNSPHIASNISFDAFINHNVSMQLGLPEPPVGGISGIIKLRGETDWTKLSKFVPEGAPEDFVPKEDKIKIIALTNVQSPNGSVNSFEGSKQVLSIMSALFNKVRKTKTDKQVQMSPEDIKDVPPELKKALKDEANTISVGDWVVTPVGDVGKVVDITEDGKYILNKATTGAGLVENVMSGEPMYYDSGVGLGSFEKSDLTKISNITPPDEIPEAPGGATRPEGGEEEDDESLKCKACGFPLTLQDQDILSASITCPVCGFVQATPGSQDVPESDISDEQSGDPDDTTGSEGGPGEGQSNQDDQDESKEENEGTESAGSGDPFDGLDDALDTEGSSKTDPGAESEDIYDENGELSSNDDEGDSTKDSPADQKARERAVESAVKDMSRQKAGEADDLSGENPLGLNSDSMSKVFGSRAVSKKTASDWKSKLRRAVATATGIREIFSSSDPSRKMEGQFGATREIPTIANVIISIDCSGSMGGSAFRKAINELTDLFMQSKGKFSKAMIRSYGWDTNIIYKVQVRGVKSSLKSQLLQFQAQGATAIMRSHEAIIKKNKRPDLFVIMSDFGDTTRDNPKTTAFYKYVKRWKHKMVFILPKGVTEAQALTVLPPDCKSRIVKLK